MQELDCLARKHAAEYYRIRKQSKQQGAGESVFPPALGGTTESEVTQSERCEEQSFEQYLAEELEMSKVVETYKILIFPDQTFKDYFRSLGLDLLRREFRRLAVLVHPDKNQHPHAKVAFQKLYNSFVQVSQESN